MNALAIAPDNRERKIIWLLSLFAAVHVLIFSATFPFFNIVDEQVHFDLVVRYSQADLPRALDPPCDEALPYITVFGTLEYIWPPASLPGGRIATPSWKLPPDLIKQIRLRDEALWKERIRNHEASQPPLYYVVAGAWWRVCRVIGLYDGTLLYALRFLNTLFVTALVWLGWIVARTFFPENGFIRLALPALIACLPQTIFYAINNDVLAPVTGGLAFLLLLKFWEAQIPGARLAAVTGLAVAATLLTKISNLPLLGIAGFFLALKFAKLIRNGPVRPALATLGILSTCAALPLAAWMTWCQINFGDFTGSAAKIQHLGWTHKPFAEWFHHPLFTPHGLWYFVRKNLATLWQGEFLWAGQPLAIPSVDLLYVLLTIALLLSALFGLWKRPAVFSPTQRTALWFGFAWLAGMFAFFALLSVKYDFQHCFYPSRARPFFTSGRLMLGMLIPFLLLFVAGLDRVLHRCDPQTKFSLLGTLLLFMLASEITVDWSIFPNEYNWFHL